MNREEILRLAREAGFNPQSLFMESRIERFASLVRDAALEEAEAKLKVSTGDLLLSGGEMTAQEIRTAHAVLAWRAAAIRSLKEQPEQPDSGHSASGASSEAPTSLLPCPFCGSSDVSRSTGTKGDGSSWPYIECHDCAACAEIDAWNERAAQSSKALSDEVCSLLDGIDRTQTEKPEGGWWETSTGAEFGEAKLTALLAILARAGITRRETNCED